MHSKKYMEIHFQDGYNSLLVESSIPELMDQGSIPELMESSNSEKNSTIISTDDNNSLLVWQSLLHHGKVFFITICGKVFCFIITNFFCLFL
jgi:hypothetical protein